MIWNEGTRVKLSTRGKRTPRRVPVIRLHIKLHIDMNFDEHFSVLLPPQFKAMSCFMRSWRLFSFRLRVTLDLKSCCHEQVCRFLQVSAPASASDQGISYRIWLCRPASVGTLRKPCVLHSPDTIHLCGIYYICRSDSTVYSNLPLIFCSQTFPGTLGNADLHKGKWQA